MTREHMLYIRVSKEEKDTIERLAGGPGNVGPFIRQRALAGSGDSMEVLTHKIREANQRLRELQAQVIEEEQRKDMLEEQYQVAQSQRSSKMELRQELMERALRRFSPDELENRDGYVMGWITGPAIMDQVEDAGFSDTEEALEWIVANIER